MPIVALRCPNCLLPQPLDHFAGACGDTIHCDYVTAVLAGDGERGRRVGRVGVSDGLGCPRKKLIMDVEDVTVNPLDFNAMLTGTAWHDKMEAHAVAPAQCEVEVEGTVIGIKVIGHIDRVRIIGSAIVLDDHKHTNDYSFGYLRKGEIKPEHECQLSVYAELYAQTLEQRPAYGMIWTHATAGGFFPRRVEFWPMERCLSFKPYGGDYCVADLLLHVQGGIEGDWRNLPLAGQSMTFGSRDACSYCAVRDVCWEAETGASF